MANPFDQFDESPKAGGNPFGQFDQSDLPSAPSQSVTPEELTAGERFMSSLPAPLKNLIGNYANGNLRGSATGRLMQGAADPGVAIAQLGANLVGQGEAVNKSIADTEAKYQLARNAVGSEGFDPLRLAGNVAMTAPISLSGGAAGTGIAKGALQGAGFSVLQPINDGSQNYWADKLSQAATGAAVGGVMAPLLGAASKIIQPNVNPNVALLQKEGVKGMTVGQVLGGAANRIEEALQSVPLLGNTIRGARERGATSLEDAAFRRASEPIGANISGRGHEGVLELKNALSKSYDNVIPRLSVDTLDPAFAGKIANLRSMAQNLPAEEARQFDNILTREVDNRLAPNGMLSGQNLKDAWNALRDESASFLKSGDKYQKDLGAALKQTFEELKTHVAATNPASVVKDLRNTDLAYANFKLIQRAASNVNAVDGRFTPSMLQSAVRAGDRSIDKGRMAEGGALMQDISNAGKDVLTNRVPNSGTADRAAIMGLVGGSAVAPAVTLPMMGALAVGNAAYTPAVQNALVTLLTKRPDMAPQIANYLRQLTGPATAAAVPMAIQSQP